MEILLTEEHYKLAKKVIILKEIDLSSFKIQDTLNPEIFDENDKMIPEVREKLLKIGNDFYDYLNIEWVPLKDIILTGSLANYNWSKFSDVDLHVVISYDKITSNSDLAEDYMWAEKELWNSNHDINIYEYPVELYAQNSKETLVAGGIYSVLHDKWLRKPERINPNFNADRIDDLVSGIEDEFEDILRKYIAGNTYGISDDIDDLKDKIRDLRKTGLNGAGEFSDENIAFKALRRMGLMDKMDELSEKAYDDDLSLSDIKQTIDDAKSFDSTPPDVSGAEKEKKHPVKPALGRYSINGRRFVSLRDAEKRLGIPKSTIEYRVKSDKPEFAAYRVLPV